MESFRQQQVNVYQFSHPQVMQVEKKFQFKGHNGAVYALERSPDENIFFSGGGDKIIAAWNVNTPGDGVMLASLPEIVYALRVIPALNILLAGQAAGGIHVMDLHTRTERRLLRYHEGGVFAIHFSAEHSLVFAAGGDGYFSVMHLEDFSLVQKIRLAGVKLRSLALHPAGQELAVGCGSGSIFVFGLPSLEIKKEIKAHNMQFSVNAVRYSPDGKFLLSGSRDAHLNVFDVKNGYETFISIPAHNYAIYSIAFSPDGKKFATASRDKTIKIWDPESWNVLLRLDHEKAGGHLNSVNNLLWKDQFLVSASDDRSLVLWEIKS